MVRVLDICEIENVLMYIFKDYDIWIMVGLNVEVEKKCLIRIL